MIFAKVNCQRKDEDKIGREIPMMPKGQLPRRPPPSPPQGVKYFVDDDPGYEAWLRSNPGGYVINTGRAPDKHYLVMHRAGCKTISGQQPFGSSWTRTSSKACASTIRELDEWAKDNTNSVSGRCGTCAP